MWPLLALASTFSPHEWEPHMWEPSSHQPGWLEQMSFYSILFYSILFYSILFCSILFYSSTLCIDRSWLGCCLAPCQSCLVGSAPTGQYPHPVYVDLDGCL